MNENELLEYQKMLDMINSYNKKASGRDDERAFKMEEDTFVIAPDYESKEEGRDMSSASLDSSNGDDMQQSSKRPQKICKPSLPPRPTPTKPVPPLRPTPSKPVPVPPWIDIKPSSDCKGACLPFAYPEVEVSGTNEGTACIIYNLFAGKASELTAFLTYTYDGAYFYNAIDNAGKTFRDIALCKQNHLNLLALLLTKLGAMPKYQNCVRGKFTWWNADTDMKYPTYLNMALLDAIDMETQMIENYNVAAADVRDPYVSTLLRRLVMDNRYHLELLTELYNGCCK